MVNAFRDPVSAVPTMTAIVLNFATMESAWTGAPRYAARGEPSVTRVNALILQDSADTAMSAHLVSPAQLMADAWTSARESSAMQLQGALMGSAWLFAKISDAILDFTATVENVYQLLGIAAAAVNAKSLKYAT